MNTELAMKALDAAKASPENFNMDTFFDRLPPMGITKDTEAIPPLCGTIACYAGFVSLLAAPVGTRIANKGCGSYVFVPDRGPVHVETYAIKALDITEEQAGILFYLENIGQVEAVVSELAGSPDTSADSLYEIAQDAG